MQDDEEDQRRPADVEMARALKTTPLRMASDPSRGTVTYWHHDPLHDVVQPMQEHVIMTYTDSLQRLERRTGRSVATADAKPGALTIIPAGSSSRWDIHHPMNVVQLYLSQKTLERICAEAGKVVPSDLLERTGHVDPTTSALLLSAADALGGHDTLDAMFRQRLTDLLAIRLLAAHVSTPVALKPTSGGLSPSVLRRAIERLRSESDSDVSLTSLARDAGVSRFHFCRAFKESTGLSPHAWLRQYRIEQARSMLLDPSNSVLSVAIALGYASQTAFAAAFKKLTGLSPSEFRRLAT